MVLQCSWYYSILLRFWHISKHRIGFARPCLAICEYCWVFTHKEIINMTISYSLVQLFLSREFPEYLIKTIAHFACISHRWIIFDWILGFGRLSHSAIHENLTFVIFYWPFNITLSLSGWSYFWLDHFSLRALL